MKFVNFFLFFWVIFALPDTGADPGTPIESGSTTLEECKEKEKDEEREIERTGPEIRIIGSFGEGPTAPGLALAKWLEGRSTACRQAS